MRPVRVATLLSFPLSEPGGVSTFVAGLHAALERELGLQPLLIAPRRFRAGPGRRVDQLALAALQVGQLWRARPDVVHVHEHPALLAAAVLYRALAGRRQIRLVYTVHVEPTARRRWWKRAVLGWLLGRCAAVTVVSSDSASKLGLIAQPPPARVRVIHGAGEVHVRSPSDPAVRALWQRLALGDGPLLVQVAPMNLPRKVAGLGLLVEAVALVRQRYPGVRLLLVGDGHLRAAVEAAARAAGVAEAVTVSGYLADVSVPLALADVYCHISLQDACPLSLLEAMYAAKPVIAARCGGIPEVVDEGYTGLLVEPRPAAIAAAIVRLLDEPALAQRLAQQAALVARRDFTWRRVATEFDTVYGVSGPLAPRAAGV